jgi:hypothetical protein
LLLSNKERFNQITDSLVLLRLIRFIGFYPAAAYYNLILKSMSRGKAFILEGLKSYDKIVKANKYP